MTDSELYYYRHWRNAGLAIVLSMTVALVAAAFFLVACMCNRPGYAIACGCVIVFAMFVAKIKSADAGRYYKRAFPRGDSESVRL